MSHDARKGNFIALSHADQIVPGSFEYALNEIVEERLDVSVFERRYRNDETGRLAYDPKVLLEKLAWEAARGLRAQCWSARFSRASSHVLIQTEGLRPFRRAVAANT